MFKDFNEFNNQLLNCKLCKDMVGRPVSGSVPNTRIISIGQAPGIHEEKYGKPFSYTAGKTLFKWLNTIGIEEEIFRRKVNMAAVCRCFPGKSKNGDRKPTKNEIENCKRFLEFEFTYHKPSLVIPIGKMAIDSLLPNKKYKLEEVIGNKFIYNNEINQFDWIPLPHPSGLNVWNNTQVGKQLIEKALEKLKNHPVVKTELLYKGNL
jgi:uracil-DNA glycosylase